MASPRVVEGYPGPFVRAGRPDLPKKSPCRERHEATSPCGAERTGNRTVLRPDVRCSMGTQPCPATEQIGVVAKLIQAWVVDDGQHTDVACRCHHSARNCATEHTLTNESVFRVSSGPSPSSLDRSSSCNSTRCGRLLNLFLGTAIEYADVRQPRRGTQQSFPALRPCDPSDSVGEGRIMWPCIPRRRALLMAAILPLVCVASMRCGYCNCPSGRTAMVVGSRCVGCDCSCDRQHACCLSFVREHSSRAKACPCQRGVFEPAFTTAANFVWTPTELSLWLDGVPPCSATSRAVNASVFARHIILPNSNRHLEHNVLRL